MAIAPGMMTEMNAARADMHRMHDEMEAQGMGPMRERMRDMRHRMERMAEMMERHHHEHRAHCTGMQATPKSGG